MKISNNYPVTLQCVKPITPRARQLADVKRRNGGHLTSSETPPPSDPAASPLRRHRLEPQLHHNPQHETHRTHAMTNQLPLDPLRGFLGKLEILRLVVFSRIN
ncbi:MAG TPA: hypothetical protein VD994_14040 [Prosthecobacter sp.]|nr:hypothetical protein [Prosthecobacter sp.]